jgi:hypothetical protein
MSVLPPSLGVAKLTVVDWRAKVILLALTSDVKDVG